jgi:hypothetical protein
MCAYRHKMDKRIELEVTFYVYVHIRTKKSKKGMTICQTDEFVHISFFGWCSFFLFYDI